MRIKSDDYEVSFNFINQNNLSISVLNTQTGEYFTNPSVQLMRINQDTIIAALNKSQQNLKTQFEQIQGEDNSFLIVAFHVNFDFLPSFHQEIRLQFVEMKKDFSEIAFKNIKEELCGVSNMVDYLQTKNEIKFFQHISFLPPLGKGEIWTTNVTKGKYILRCSGTINNPSAVGGLQKISFWVVGQKQSQQIAMKTHNQTSYHYPFFFSQVVQTEDGVIKVLANCFQQMQNARISNAHFMLTKVLEIAG